MKTLMFIIFLTINLLSFSQGTWINFDTSNGLANNETRAILEDNSGNMWFSWKDITKYDGTNWTIYDTILPYHYLRDIAEDNNGNLWFASDVGILKYDGVSWTAYDTTVEGYHLGSWTICADSYGNIWCGRSTIYKFNGSQWIKYDSTNSNLPLPKGDLRDIMEDNEGNIWFCGTDGIGVFKYDGTNWTVFSYENGTLPDSYRFKVMDQDTSGNIWFGTYFSGIIKYDGTNWIQYTTSNGLTDNNAYGLVIDNDNYVWQGILYDDGGVCKFDGTSCTYYDTSNGLINNLILTVYKDKTGNLWFGTAGGVSKLILNTGLDLFSSSSNNIIYPNPSTGQFFVQVPTNTQNYNIEIYNMLGKIIYSNQNILNADKMIDISDKPNGMYFVKITMSGKIFTQKIVKK